MMKKKIFRCNRFLESFDEEKSKTDVFLLDIATGESLELSSRFFHTVSFVAIYVRPFIHLILYNEGNVAFPYCHVFYITCLYRFVDEICKRAKAVGWWGGGWTRTTFIMFS
jgi:hypothetical protein